MPFAALAQEEEDIVKEFSTGEIDPDVWYLDTEVIINGTYLNGPAPSQSKLCFAPEANKDDLRCFQSGHPNITKWTYSNITFVPPKNTPPNGVIILIQPETVDDCHVVYGEYTCSQKILKHHVEIGSYKAQPHISNVIDVATGESATYLQAGKEYEVAGYRFGDSGVGLYLNDRLIDKQAAKRWTHDNILFVAPDTYDGAENLRVHNGAGKGNMWEFEDSASTVYSSVTTKTRGTLLVKDVVNASSVKAQLSEQDDGSFQSSSDETAGVETEGITPVYEQYFRDNPDEWFSDVSMEDPYFPAIAWGYYFGLISGYDDGTYQPENPVNRAEFLKVILLQSTSGAIDYTKGGNTPFLDIAGDEWFAPFVEMAYEGGVVDGYRNGKFHPEQTVNFAEALKIAYKQFEVPTLDPEGSEWYARYTEHAIGHNLLFDSEVAFDEGMSRKDVIWVLWKLMEMKDGE